MCFAIISHVEIVNVKYSRAAIVCNLVFMGA